MEILMSAQVLQWMGCVFGLSGSLLLAGKTRISGYGFVLFLVSNGFWMAYGVATHAPGLIVMQLGFTVSSGIGVWKWVVKPGCVHSCDRMLPQGMRMVKGRPMMRHGGWVRT